jgi:uncharacterized protein (TIGR03437 family)
LSRSGRFLSLFGYFRLDPFRPVPIHQLRDLETGTVRDVPIYPASTSQAITNAGAVYGFVPPNPGTLRRWDPDGSTRTFPFEARPAVVDSLERFLVYERGIQSTELRAFDTATARDTLLASGLSSYSPSISADGETVVFAAPDGLFAGRPDGSNRRRIAGAAEPFSSAVVSGDGRIACAITASGRLLRIDLVGNQTRELAGPAILVDGVTLVPGSVQTIYSRFDTSRAYRVLIDGQPAPIVSLSESELRFQVPVELFAREAERLTVEVPQDFALDTGARLLPVISRMPGFFLGSGTTLLAAHQDFRSLVTSQSPARPGGIVHLYAAGLGPVAGAVETGKPADGARPITTPFRCTVAESPMEVLYAGLAPGFLGVYQVSVRLPETLPQTESRLVCGFPVEDLWSGGFLPTGTFLGTRAKRTRYGAQRSRVPSGFGAAPSRPLRSLEHAGTTELGRSSYLP